MKYYLKAFKNYANFEGRARRSEYWFFVLFHMLISLSFIGLSIAIKEFLDASFGGIIFGIYFLSALIPWIALMARRLHDTNKSGWLILIRFIPFGAIVLLVFYCMDGDDLANKYGPNPKHIRNAEEIDQIGLE